MFDILCAELRLFLWHHTLQSQNTHVSAQNEVAEGGCFMVTYGLHVCGNAATNDPVASVIDLSASGHAALVR